MRINQAGKIPLDNKNARATSKNTDAIPSSYRSLLGPFHFDKFFIVIAKHYIKAFFL